MPCAFQQLTPGLYTAAGRVFGFLILRTPEPARERCLANLAALARTRITGRSAVFANPVVALIIAKDIATRSRSELRPAALERQFRASRVTRRRFCQARAEQQSGENHNNGHILNSV